jgi:hypothetical protein
MTNKVDCGNDVLLEMDDDGNYDENEDCEEATVEQIAVNRQNTPEDQKTDEDEFWTTTSFLAGS